MAQGRIPATGQTQSTQGPGANLSEGCVTVLDLARWADIHEALISHRSADGAGLALLVVKGTPERAR